VHVVREARPDDNSALIELERSSPLELGDRSLVFDRAPDFFLHQEVQEHGRLLVAEEEGALVGVVAGAWHDVLIEGQKRRLLYIHQGRVLPTHQRRHVATDLVLENAKLCAGAGVDTPYWLISPDNKTSLAFGERTGMENWPVQGRMDGFDVAAAGSAADERVGAVGLDDIHHIVELINRTHGGRELFMPYSAEFLTRRLSLSPTYGWRHWRGYRHGEELVAAAGFWDYGCCLRMTQWNKLTGEERVSAPAFVLDYGYAEGHEEAMAAVFMELMKLAAERGRSELTISLPVESRLFALMEPLPHSTTVFEIIVPGIPTPRSIDRSVYLDPIYV
jgi:hypothetical protein